MNDAGHAIMTIRQLTMLRVERDPSGAQSAAGGSGAPAELELKFTVSGQTATLRFDEVGTGSVLSVNRSFLVDPGAKLCLEMVISGGGLDGSWAFTPRIVAPTRHRPKIKTGAAAVHARKLACTLSYDIRWTTTGRPSSGASASLYAIPGDGRLLWYRHASRDDGAWLGPRQVGAGWERYLHVFSGGAGVIYAVQPDGELLWRRHLGSADGSPAWDGPKPVGAGWQYFRKIVCDGAGVIYAVDKEGGLWWYRHEGYLSGDAAWEGPNQIGEGWNEFSEVVAGGDGVIYATVGHTVFANLAHSGGIKYRQGDLTWHRHAGVLTGECSWFEPRRVGRGWDCYSRFFSDGADTLYAIVAADQTPYRQGDLLRCRHLGHAGGAWQWSETRCAGSGWSGLKTMFCALPAPPSAKHISPHTPSIKRQNLY